MIKYGMWGSNRKNNYSNTEDRWGGLFMKKLFICVLAALLLCSCSLGSTGEKSNVTNPVTEYQTIEQVNEKTGFEMVMLPEQYVPTSYTVIDGLIAQVGYTLNETAAITFRMAEGNADISGIYGVDPYENTTIHEVAVQYGMYNDIHVAWFARDEYTYALTAEEMNGTDFMALVNAAISAIVSPPVESEEP